MQQYGKTPYWLGVRENKALATAWRQGRGLSGWHPLQQWVTVLERARPRLPLFVFSEPAYSRLCLYELRCAIPERRLAGGGNRDFQATLARRICPIVGQPLTAFTALM